MTECAICGTELKSFETRCPTCGRPTAHYHRQRRCLHCGTPAAQKIKTCLMCGQPVDSLPLRTSFSGSWLGVILGVAIIVGLVMWVNSYQPLANHNVQAAQGTPTPTATGIPTITSTPTTTPLPTDVVTVVPTPTPRTHTVERGQTLYYIARQYQVSIEEIVTLNELTDSRILRVGQVLLIPESSVSSENGNELPLQIVHVIQPGETLSGLSYEYDTPMDAIITANPGVNMDLIYEGQEIIIPLAMPTPTSTPTPLPTATPTATPLFISPDLLTPVDGQVVTEPVLFFNWTATGWLAGDEFYVLQLTWPDGSTSEHWTKSTSWRIAEAERLAPGSVTWQVTIMRQTGTTADGFPVGVSLADSGEGRTVNWSNPVTLDESIKNYLVTNVEAAGFNGKIFCAFEVLTITEKEDGTEVEVYLWALCQEYYQENQTLRPGTGVSLPAALVVEDRAEEGYEVVSHRVPRDGSFYGSDIQEIFPKRIWPSILADVDDHNQRVQTLEREVEKEAQAYFASGE